MSSTKASSVRSEQLLRNGNSSKFAVVGNRGSVVKCDFYTKLKKLDVQGGQEDFSPIM